MSHLYLYATQTNACCHICLIISPPKKRDSVHDFLNNDSDVTLHDVRIISKLLQKAKHVKMIRTIS